MDLKDLLQEERRGPEGALPEDGPVASAGHLPPLRRKKKKRIIIFLPVLISHGDGRRRELAQ